MESSRLTQALSDLAFVDEAAIAAMTAIIQTADLVETKENRTIFPGCDDYGQYVAKASFLIATAMLEQRETVRSLYQQALDEQEEGEAA